MVPWMVGAVPGSEAWVTVVTCGAPEWRRCSIVRQKARLDEKGNVVNDCYWLVRTEDGREHHVHQYQLRLVAWLQRQLS